MNWPMVALGEIAEINPRIPKSVREAPDETISFVPMASVSEQGQVIASEPRSASEVLKGYTFFQRGDVLVAKITPCYENNKTAIAEIDTRYGFGTTEFHVLRADERHLDPAYLHHLIRTDRVRSQGAKRMTGSGGQRRVPKAYFETLEIPLPPLDEQKRIAAILDKADALRRARERSISISSKFSAALFQSMFGDWRQERSDFPIVELGDHLTRLTSGSRGWAKYYADSGAAFIRIQNVRCDFFDRNDLAHVDAPENAEARRTSVAAGDVLMSITADLGRTAVVPDDLGPAHINQHLVVMNANDFAPRFLSAAIASPSGQHFVMKRNREAVKAGLNFDDVRSIKLVMPPLPAQEEFAQRVARAERLTTQLQSSQAAASNLFTALQHRAFAGEL